MSIVQTTTQIRKNRQDYEWRFTISFWTLIVAAIFYTGNLPLFDTRCVRLWAATVAIFAYVCFWLVGVHWGHVRDRKIGMHYLKTAQDILSNYNIALPQVDNRLKFQWWGLVFQSLVTLLLLSVFVFSR